ncbi:MAG: phosphohydrolase [Treponema sp.]|nr:phosphohydrolase [Treponema sp.]
MINKKFSKLDCKEIKLGMRFSAPVFFDDGENMFLGEEKSIKNYHIDAIQRWNIKYLLTYGHLIGDGKNPPPESLYMLEDLEDVEELN